MVKIFESQWNCFKKFYGRNIFCQSKLTFLGWPNYQASGLDFYDSGLFNHMVKLVIFVTKSFQNSAILCLCCYQLYFANNKKIISMSSKLRDQGNHGIGFRFWNGASNNASNIFLYSRYLYQKCIWTKLNKIIIYRFLFLLRRGSNAASQMFLPGDI